MNLSIRTFIMVGIMAMLFSLMIKVISIKYDIPLLKEISNA
jgi:hypothetical protein